MPNFPSWKSRFYIIKNKEFLTRELNCSLISETADSYLLIPEDMGIEEINNSHLVKCKDFKALPLMSSSLDMLIHKYHEQLSYYKYSNNLIIRGKKWDIKFPQIMAIMNFTPDSFYGRSRTSMEQLDSIAEKMKELGISIVDIGGESTRPGSLPVSSEEEWRRIERPIKFLVDKGFFVSVDSYKPEIQKMALEIGSHIINDVKGLEKPEMAEIAAKYDVPVILMHSRGDFKTMQDNPYYENTILEILDFFMERIGRAKEYGIADNVILDPGIGFGKRVDDNLRIIKYLNELKLGRPLLIGLSRKSFLGKILGEDVNERLISSIIMDTISIINGADIIRVHDFEEHIKLIKLINEIKKL